MALVDPALLARAAEPGRIRGIALQIWRAARAEPSRASAILRAGLRDARALHSRERRLASDLLYDLVRHQQVLARALGTDDDEALWAGALTLRGASLGLPFRDLDEARALAVRRLDDLDALAVLAAAPREVAAELRRAFGPRAEAFVDASNARAPVVLRARGDRDALIRRLAEEGVQASPSPVAPRGVRVEGRANLWALASFREGAFEVQDEGSQLVADLLEPEGVVVDYCAGAGGKTLAMARPGVRLVALDVRRRALDELRRRARRAGVDVEVHAIDDGPLPLPEASADRVLVDAPCSGTGVWRRHPELRWRLDADRLDALQRTQGALLDRAATLVRPGGRLVYATCSVLPREDEDVVEAFRARHPRFALERTLRLAPHTDGTDGFFGAALRG